MACARQSAFVLWFSVMLTGIGCTREATVGRVSPHAGALDQQDDPAPVPAFPLAPADGGMILGPAIHEAGVPNGLENARLRLPDRFDLANLPRAFCIPALWPVDMGSMLVLQGDPLACAAMVTPELNLGHPALWTEVIKGVSQGDAPSCSLHVDVDQGPGPRLDGIDSAHSCFPFRVQAACDAADPDDPYGVNVVADSLAGAGDLIDHDLGVSLQCQREVDGRPEACVKTLYRGGEKLCEVYFTLTVAIVL